jgi:ribulose-bisphosphate carboxylase large chain
LVLLAKLGKAVLPVASGGLHPALVPDLINTLGNNIMCNFGGGIHGHPDGSKAGARSVMEAFTAVQTGVTLEDYAQNHTALKRALEKWAH